MSQVVEKSIARLAFGSADYINSVPIASLVLSQ
jgi:hypothetical protein